MGQRSFDVGRSGYLDTAEVLETALAIRVVANAIGSPADLVGNAADIGGKALPLGGNSLVRLECVSASKADDLQGWTLLNTRGFQFNEQ